jgi:hypothetical protein
MVYVKTDPFDLEQVQVILSPELWELFMQMQPGEKDHAVTLYRRLVERGDTQPDLLRAALLHDVGKIRYCLNPLQRTLVVLAKKVMPGKARQWGNLSPDKWKGLPSWRKAFVVAEQHPDWGAELAHDAGVSALTETLIREHHHPNMQGIGDDESNLLNKLWVVDNDS